jgi:hypothetical protein
MITAISVIDSNLLFNKALGQNATSQTPARRTLENLIEKVKPTLEHVDQIIDALRNNDGSEAFDEVILTVTELLKITESPSIGRLENRR